VIGFLREPERYGRLGGRVPKGILLLGPPETLLARAVAGEAGVPFFSISLSSSSRCSSARRRKGARPLRAGAQACAAIIFIDELDVLGRASGAYPMGRATTRRSRRSMSSWWSSTGSTQVRGSPSRPPTGPRSSIRRLLRAGRFDRQILVDRPDKHGRIDMLNRPSALVFDEAAS
jgi:cell division protease FtsH